MWKDDVVITNANSVLRFMTIPYIDYTITNIYQSRLLIFLLIDNKNKINFYLFIFNMKFPVQILPVLTAERFLYQRMAIQLKLYSHVQQVITWTVTPPWPVGPLGHGLILHPHVVSVFAVTNFYVSFFISFRYTRWVTSFYTYPQLFRHCYNTGTVNYSVFSVLIIWSPVWHLVWQTSFP